MENAPTLLTAIEGNSYYTKRVSENFYDVYRVGCFRELGTVCLTTEGWWTSGNGRYYSNIVPAAYDVILGITSLQIKLMAQAREKAAAKMRFINAWKERQNAKS